MKTIVVLISLLLSSLTSWEQTLSSVQNSFIGHWEDKDWADRNITSDYLVVTKDTAKFFLLQNILNITCRSSYNSDTLLLYIINVDHAHIVLEHFTPPKRNSLFAKCYIKNEQLHIIYTQKWFVNNIKKLDLDTVLSRTPLTSSLMTISPEQKNFLGNWFYADPSDKSLSLNILDIAENEASFKVMVNQLDLVCKLQYQNDTLLLYVSAVDCGRLFWPGNYSPPGYKSLFAKCYIKANRLNIIYTQKLFSNNITKLGLYTCLTRP